MATVAAQAPQPGMLKGFYNKHSATQASSAHNCQSLLGQAAEQVPLDRTRALHIAEWGCAHGGNSISPVYAICQSLSKRIAAGQGGLDVHVSHTDVTGNSWSELFTCAQQYQKQVHDSLPEVSVTYSGVGSSQYVRNHPSRALDLGFTYNALHWLSSWPCRLKHSMTPFAGKVLPEETAALTAQATEDLKTFLTLRAEEFRPGGFLVMSFGTMGGEHKESLELFKGPQAVVEQMVAEGLLREEELGQLAPPIYFLDEAAQHQVFTEVSDKWELLHYDVALSSNPQAEAVHKDGLPRAAYGQMVSDFIKAAMCPFMEAGLKAAGRDQETSTTLLDALFTRLADHLAANPVPVGYPSTRVLLRRRD